MPSASLQPVVNCLLATRVPWTFHRVIEVKARARGEGAFPIRRSSNSLVLQAVKSNKSAALTGTIAVTGTIALTGSSAGGLCRLADAGKTVKE